jgi:hypothetical protein
MLRDSMQITVWDKRPEEIDLKSVDLLGVTRSLNAVAFVLAYMNPSYQMSQSLPSSLESFACTQYREVRNRGFFCGYRTEDCLSEELVRWSTGAKHIFYTLR